ncbi:hypothetical protein CALCODRAFT_486992 [Calocera cornea HHB12733]|uniref:Uncharacterized protein n=1 Tax=Calocera cornea HHB12733 TaxID=1353952 RepID=A0A165DDR4_9BASI|nr:hypothetical protein CALCODRAFT_486992 [Calocera cornea HHB12733]
MPSPATPLFPPPTVPLPPLPTTPSSLTSEDVSILFRQSLPHIQRRQKRMSAVSARNSLASLRPPSPPSVLYPSSEITRLLEDEAEQEFELEKLLGGPWPVPPNSAPPTAKLLTGGFHTIPEESEQESETEREKSEEKSKKLPFTETAATLVAEIGSFESIKGKSIICQRSTTIRNGRTLQPSLYDVVNFKSPSNSGNAATKGSRTGLSPIASRVHVSTKALRALRSCPTVGQFKSAPETGSLPSTATPPAIQSVTARSPFQASSTRAYAGHTGCDASLAACLAERTRAPSLVAGHFCHIGADTKAVQESLIQDAIVWTFFSSTNSVESFYPVVQELVDVSTFTA